MPRDLFGDVTRPSISIGSRKWYTVPVSLLSHALAVGLVIAVPILAPSMLPEVWSGDVIAYVTDDPSTAAAAPAGDSSSMCWSAQPANPNAAPIEAPTGVQQRARGPAHLRERASHCLASSIGDVTDGPVEPVAPPRPSAPVEPRSRWRHDSSASEDSRCHNPCIRRWRSLRRIRGHRDYRAPPSAPTAEVLEVRVCYGRCRSSIRPRSTRSASGNSRRRC